MSSSILITSHTHICRNPRVLKEAITLSNAGYQVTVLTAIYNTGLLDEDRELLKGSNVKYLFYSDLRTTSLKSLKQKLVRKATLIAKQRLNKELPHSLGYGFADLKRLCLKQHADLYIMHQEIPLLVGAALIKKGKKVAFDLEDWYSEDLLPEARATRPLTLLKNAEQFALINGVYCTTTSHALAAQLANTYQSKLPNVVYNVFPPASKTTHQQFTDPLKFLWFSQTIGPGRGLEEFIELTNQIHHPLELHLLGAENHGYQAKLKTLLSSQHKLYFHKLVPENQLHEKIANFDIGLALEMLTPPSRNFTITNKLFQYMQAGLPVIATRTAGQMEVFTKYQPGILINLPAEANDIETVNSWLSKPELLQKAAQAAMKAAHEYNWENESKKLLYLVEKALNE